MIVIATDNRSLLIYEHSTLVWCAELMTETIALKRGNFIGLSGAIVTLDPKGKVSIGYLGSDPHIFKVPPLNLSKLDYEKSRTELEEMEREINSSVDNSGLHLFFRFLMNSRNFTSIFADIPFINEQAQKDLEIKSKLNFESLNDGIFARLHLTITPHINLEQVQLFIIQNPTFIIQNNIFYCTDLQAHENYSFETEISLSGSEKVEIFSTALLIMVSFINKQSIARVLQHSVAIPMNSVAKLVMPQKEGDFKVTINVAESSVEIKDIFKGG